MDFDLEKVTFSEMFLVQDLIKQAQKYGNIPQICYNKCRAFVNLTKFIGFFNSRFGKCLRITPAVECVLKRSDRGLW